MSFTLKIISGLVGELTGQDLDSLPKNLGRLIGSTIKGQFDKNGKLSHEAKGKLERIIHENPEVATEVMKLALKVEAEYDSLLVDYLSVINSVVNTINNTQMPIVLHGFLHDEACLSYWHFDEESYGHLLDYKIDNNQIEIGRSDFHPCIYLLPSENVLKDLELLNLEIRKSDKKSLAPSIYKDCYCVQTIEEFKVITKILPNEEDEDLDLFPDLNSTDIKSSEKYWDIPDGAPSLSKLISSISVALKVQASPKSKLSETIKRANKGT